MNPLNVDCSRKNLATILSMVVVVVLALILRLQMIEHSVVDHPIRADASQYYHYAVNLKQHGIYSMSRPNQDGVPPVADAHRNPGYALFIYPYVEFPPTLQMVYKVEMVQVLLSALTILLMASAMKSVLGLRLSICLGCLIALSPHLVSANIYLLTECLFTFLLALMAFLFSRFISRKNLLYMVLFGVTLAVALLVRPTMKYFYENLVIRVVSSQR